jgi:hypothetical protein
MVLILILQYQENLLTPVLLLFTLNRIGILTKSLIYLAINNTGSNIVLQPNQKLKVTYTLSILARGNYGRKNCNKQI